METLVFWPRLQEVIYHAESCAGLVGTRGLVKWARRRGPDMAMETVYVNFIVWT